MEQFSIFSAVIGGFVTAIFAYLARFFLIRRSEKKRQQRLALLYLIEFSQIVAGKQAIELTFKEELKIFKEKIKDSKIKEYPFQFICVHLSKDLQNKSAYLMPFIGELARFKDSLSIWTNVDEYLGFKIDDELLSTLPDEAIVQYKFFVGQALDIRTYLMSWISAFEKNDFTHFDPDTLFNQIMGFKNLYNEAALLRTILIAKAKIRNRKADKILKQQLKHYTTHIVTLQNNRKIIEVCKEFGEKASAIQIDQNIQT